VPTPVIELYAKTPRLIAERCLGEQTNVLIFWFFRARWAQIWSWHKMAMND